MAQKQKSRPARWADAVGECRAAMDALDAAYGDLESALSDLRDIQSEYEEWQGNLPENAQEGATADKLSAIVDDLEIPENPREFSYDDLENAISEAENAELPLGFGRD